MLISTSAIVLNTIPFGDTSVISRLYTEEMGKISVLAKGAWRPKNTAGALLEPMNHINIQFYNKNTRNIQILKDAVFNHQFSILRRHLERILLGLAVVETLDKTTLENNPNPILYRLGWRVLEKLNEESQDYWMILTFFFYQLALRLGFMPNLKKCSKCNLEITSGCFDELIGELVCMDCTSKSKINLSVESLNLLRQVEKMHLDELGTLTIKSNLVMEPILFLEFFLTFQLEGLRTIQSMRIIRQLINSNSNLAA